MINSPETPINMEPSLNLSKELREYQYREPLSSALSYQYPLKETLDTTQVSPKLIQGIKNKNIQQVGPHTIEIGSPAHVGPHSGSIDFIIQTGSEIVAAANGEVVSVVDHHPEHKLAKQIFNNFGPKGLYRITGKQGKKLNQIIIKHTNNDVVEFTRYCHLGFESSKVQVGQSVETGVEIGRTGWSGWMDRPHLHFQVFRTENLAQWPNEHFETLTPQWLNQS